MKRVRFQLLRQKSSRSAQKQAGIHDPVLNPGFASAIL
jgi:hypothetical protein